ncbi:hypothetical protein GGX14DRAFT_392496 [Mycena pura]|uniref:Ricin B lectin domain-containing protein n=1 Tax=Mycena pura TaxID=153505 RepID=A0AAD6YJ73_9AGAR|nr:hypothetical protein GGX14DRAFT_392496 [Mycena pura]
MFFTLASLAFAATALVQAQIVPVGTTINIQDFKGNVLDLTNGAAGQNTPVQTLPHGPSDFAQAWVIQPTSNGLFIIQNVASKTFLSYAVASTAVDPLNTQLVGNSNPFSWNIIGTGVGFLFAALSVIASIVGPSGTLGPMAVTSWPILNETTSDNILPLRSTPLTLQSRDSTRNAPVQTFTFVPCDVRAQQRQPERYGLDLTPITAIMRIVWNIYSSLAMLCNGYHRPSRPSRAWGLWC